MKLLPPLPPPKLMGSKTPPPRPARLPLARAEPAWRPDPGYAASARPGNRGDADGSWRDRLRNLPRSRLIIAALTLAIVGTMVTLFLIESRYGYTPREDKIVYFKSWSADRSEADVAADNAADVARARADAAASRAYIATLQGPARAAALHQYEAYLAAQPKALQPPGFVPPKPQ